MTITIEEFKADDKDIHLKLIANDINELKGIKEALARDKCYKTNDPYQGLVGKPDMTIDVKEFRRAFAPSGGSISAAWAMQKMLGKLELEAQGQNTSIRNPFITVSAEFSPVEFDKQKALIRLSTTLNDDDMPLYLRRGLVEHYAEKIQAAELPQVIEGSMCYDDATATATYDVTDMGQVNSQVNIKKARDAAAAIAKELRITDGAAQGRGY